MDMNDLPLFPLLVIVLCSVLVVGYVNFFAFYFGWRSRIAECLNGEEQVRLTEWEEKADSSWAWLVLAPFVGWALAAPGYRKHLLEKEVQQIQDAVKPSRESSLKLYYLPRQNG
jgi:hypothetical protein